MIRDVNDSPEQAEALARTLAQFPCRLNLIPLSRVSEHDGGPSAAGAARTFVERLTRAGINTTLRSSRGGVIDAACGQLRLRSSGPESPASPERSELP
jgi:23S rRNA (adenine2503-C2)-methyltransferase